MSKLVSICAYQFVAIAGGIAAAFGSGNDFVAFGITPHFEVAVLDCQSDAGQKDADENDDKDATYFRKRSTTGFWLIFPTAE